MGFFNLGKAVKYLDPLKIDSSRCLLNISPLSSCQKCQDICPTRGLEYTNELWQYDNCNDCGLCAAVCPQKVFTFDREKLAHEQDKNILLACLEQGEISGAISCHCLQQFTLEEIAKLAGQNKSVAIFAAVDSCEACGKGFWIDGLKLRLQSLKLADNIVFLHDKKELQAWQREHEEQNLSRRTFFEQLSQKGQQEIKNLAQKATDETEKVLTETIEHFSDNQKAFEVEKVVSERQIVYEMLKDKDLSDEEVNLPYHLLKNNACIFCEACVRLCPTKALQIIENNNGAKSLNFNPVLCNECELCQDICPEKGFFWDFMSLATFLSADEQVLVQAQKQICQNCGEEFWQYPSKDNICRFCQV